MSPDQTLFEEWIHHGDAEAFARLSSKYAPLVYAACLRVLHNGADAEDLTQECFETLAVQKKAPRTSVGGWLHKVATHRALNRLRADRRRKSREERFAAQGDAHKAADWDDIYEHIDEAIAQLPEKPREAILAHFLEGLTHEAIAQREGVSRVAITQRIQRGLQQIRKLLRKRAVLVTPIGLSALMRTHIAEASTPLPPALAATLGKLAVSSGITPGVAGIPTFLGALAAHKLLAAGAIAAIAAVTLAGAWFVWPRMPQAPSPAVMAAAAPGSAVQDPPAAPVLDNPSPKTENTEGSEEDTLQTTCMVSGKVLMDSWQPGDGPANVGASILEIVDGQERGGKEVATAKVAVGGTYRFENLPPGPYRIAARLRATHVARDATLNPGDVVEDLDLHIQSTNSSIGGHARDPDGNPLEGVTVRLYTGIGTLFLTAETSTDGNGYYEIRHLAHQMNPQHIGPLYYVRFALPGYHTYNDYHQIVLQKGEARHDLDTVLVPGIYTLSGRVITDTGRPAADLPVSGAGQTTRTRADGSFTLEHLLDPCKVTVDIGTKGPWATAEPKAYEFQGAGDETGAVFSLTLGGEVVGTLHTDDGGDFEARWIWLDDGRRAEREALDGHRTYASGAPFTFHGVLPGERCLYVEITDYTYANYLSKPFQVHAGQTTDLGRIVLTKGGTLKGRITFPGGLPAPGYVYAEPLRAAMGRPRTYKKSSDVLKGGYYEINRMMPGPYTVGLRNSKDRQRLIIEDGKTTTLDFTHHAAEGALDAAKKLLGTDAQDAALAGQVFWDNGTPAAGATWTVETSGLHIDGTTGEDGQFRAEGLNRTGQYRLKINCGQQRYKEYHIPREGLRITFKRPATISGRLLLPHEDLPSQPAQFALLWPNGPQALGSGPDETGTFYFAFVPQAETVSLLIQSPRFTNVVVNDIRVALGSSANLGALRMDPGFEVHGIVRDSSGQTVPYARITARPSWLKSIKVAAYGGALTESQGPFVLPRTALTDSQGRFVLQHIGAETYDITVQPRSGHEPHQETLPLQQNTPLKLTLEPSSQP